VVVIAYEFLVKNLPTTISCGIGSAAAVVTRGFAVILPMLSMKNLAKLVSL